MSNEWKNEVLKIRIFSRQIQKVIVDVISSHLGDVSFIYFQNVQIFQIIEVFEAVFEIFIYYLAFEY